MEWPIYPQNLQYVLESSLYDSDLVRKIPIPKIFWQCVPDGASCKLTWVNDSTEEEEEEEVWTGTVSQCIKEHLVTNSTDKLPMPPTSLHTGAKNRELTKTCISKILCKPLPCTFNILTKCQVISHACYCLHEYRFATNPNFSVLIAYQTYQNSKRLYWWTAPVNLEQTAYHWVGTAAEKECPSTNQQTSREEQEHHLQLPLGNVYHLHGIPQLNHQPIPGQLLPVKPAVPVQEWHDHTLLVGHLAAIKAEC